MLTLTIEDKRVESIFLNEFHSNKESFFEFIQQSYAKMQLSLQEETMDKNFINIQESSMQKTWDNDQDKVWDEL